MTFTSRGGCIVQLLRPVSRKNIECTRCHQLLPITEFPPEYVLGNKKNPLCRACKKERFKALREKLAKARDERKDYPTEKECKRCGQFKPLSEFTESLSFKDGLHSYCRSCQAQQRNEMRARWKKERKKTSPPKEKICTRCYRVYPLSNFCSNDAHKDGYDNICKNCRMSRNQQYAKRWIEERKTTPPPEKKRCPGCGKMLPLSSFWAHEKRKDGVTSYCIDCYKHITQKNVKKWKKQREKQKNIPQNKECNLCHIVKPVDQFYPNKRLKDGYSGTCIVCEEKRVQQYMQQWKEQGNVLPEEKQCIHCKRVLSADHFVFNKRKKDGLSSVCRECEKEKREQYKQKWEQERKKKDQQGFTLFPTFEKKCSQCGQVKPLGLFGPSKNSKDGYASYCKQCGRKRQNEYNERIKSSKKVIPTVKFCSSCKQTLPASEFNTCNQRKDGLFIYCKTCQNKKNKEYRNRPEAKERLKEWTKEYLKKPEVRKKTRARARRYYNQPHVKAKAAVYRKKHRAKPEVKKRRQQYEKEYYKRKKAESKAL